MKEVNKKTEVVYNGSERPATTPNVIEKLTPTQLFYKKLAAYLLLLYQAYMKSETTLEPEIKMALARMVKFDSAFAAKVRMTQMDYLNVRVHNLEAEWDEEKDDLFPIEERGIRKTPNPKRGEIIDEYKKAVAELLQSVY
jgi:hypothetical protein